MTTEIPTKECSAFIVRMFIVSICSYACCVYYHDLETNTGARNCIQKQAEETQLCVPIPV